MVSGLTGVDLDTEYRTGDGDLVRDFYRPCLAQATGYDRAVGYFRSAVFTLAGYEILEFARRGGRIRLVCSPSLSPEDFEAIASGYHNRSEVIASALERDIDNLLSSVDLQASAELLATFISLNILDLQIAVRPPDCGIYHEKLGIFSDSLGNAVSFRGSSNETWQGWHERGNLESFEVFCSWRGGTESTRVERHRAYFEMLWEHRVSDVEVLPFPEAARRKLCKIAKGSIEDLEPSFQRNTDSRTLRPHQVGALAAWRDRGFRGIFEHATGSGKTLTALAAARDHVGSGGVALILVPTTVLFNQWTTEIARALPDAVVLRVGAGNHSWTHTGRLEDFSRAVSGAPKRVILATMQTASREDFRRRLQGGEHLMIVADEVHQTGSPENSQIFGIASGPRLGLSATPVRYGDPDGTRLLMDFFGGVVPPPFMLNDAIRAGLLVPYEYFPHPVTLSSAENEAWTKITLEIRREIARLGPERKDFALSERARLLLIQRARIAKKAVNKIALATQVLRDHFRDGHRWLVYCEDSVQLTQVMERLRSSGLQVNEFHSKMQGDPGETLRWFRRFGGVLVSIRCLDEGVDIPDVSHALILASSQNPRQFIQRRGRVLRRAPGKALAVVHDAIVVPENLVEESDQTALAKAEILRAVVFAESALNRLGAAELRDIAARMGLVMTDLARTGVEEDNGEA